LPPTFPSRPAAVRWIVALAWLRLALFALIVTVAVAFVTPFESQLLEGMRQGWLGHTRYPPEAYGYREAGEISGRAVIPALLAALVLIFVWRRRLIALRIAAALGVVFSLTAPLALLFNVPILVLAFLGSTRGYMQGESRVFDGPSPPA
jgi:hypothetical protein